MRLFHSLNNLEDGIERKLADGMTTRIYAGENVMLSIVSLEPDAEGEIHSHQEEQWGLLLSGSGIRLQGGVEHPVDAGDFWLTPSGISHGFRAGPEGARILDIFSPPREEYINAGKDFGSV